MRGKTLLHVERNNLERKVFEKIEILDFLFLDSKFEKILEYQKNWAHTTQHLHSGKFSQVYTCWNGITWTDTLRAT